MLLDFLNERVAEGNAFDPHDFEVGARVKSTLNEVWRNHMRTVGLFVPIYFWQNI